MIYRKNFNASLFYLCLKVWNKRIIQITYSMYVVDDYSNTIVHDYSYIITLRFFDLKNDRVTCDNDRREDFSLLKKTWINYRIITIDWLKFHYFVLSTLFFIILNLYIYYTYIAFIFESWRTEWNNKIITYTKFSQNLELL